MPKKIRPELMQGDAREPRNRRHVLGWHNVPLMRGIPAQVEGPAKSSRTPCRLDSGSAGFPSMLENVVHKQKVEKCSTIRKLYDREHLDGVRRGFPPSSAAMSDDHGKREVGDRLRQAREALGYSMAEFARLHGIDKTKLNHWEKGKHYPDPQFIRALYERHRVNADWVYLGVLAGLRHDLAESLRAAGQGSSAASQAVENPPAEKNDREPQDA